MYLLILAALVNCDQSGVGWKMVVMII